MVTSSQVVPGQVPPLLVLLSWFIVGAHSIYAWKNGCFASCGVVGGGSRSSDASPVAVQMRDGSPSSRHIDNVWKKQG